jgi:hypothetical protein
MVSLRKWPATISLSLVNCLIACIPFLLRQASVQAIAYAGGAKPAALRTG